MLRENIPFRAKYIAREASRLTAGRLANFLMPKVKRFVILTNGRSGSTLLVSYLRQNSNIRLYGEIFGKYYLAQPMVRELIRRDGAVSYFKNMQSRCLAESHVGVKILYSHLEPSYGEERGVPDLPAVVDELVRDKDIKILHLRRDNLLDIAISGMLAKLTKSYSGRDYGDLRIVLPVDRCRQTFEQLQRQSERYRTLFSEHDYLEITYEDLVDTPDGTLASAFAFLGAELVAAQTTLKKQNRSPRETVVTNYAELKEAFANTPFARFFG